MWRRLSSMVVVASTSVDVGKPLNCQVASAYLHEKNTWSVVSILLQHR